MKNLEERIKKANFDGAFHFLNDLEKPDPDKRAQEPERDGRAKLHERVSEINNAFDRLSVSCMIADVFDYAGQYGSAGDFIRDLGPEAEGHLRAFLKDPVPEENTSADDVKLYKQECWAVMHLGMWYYRKHKYDLALDRFNLSKNFLVELWNRKYQYRGSLSRAWYCIGLCHRQNHRYATAKEAFSKSVEYGWRGLEARGKEGRPIEPYDYNVGKCFGLGTAWIKYSEASLAEAYADLVVAQRLLFNKEVRFISAYIQIIHACVRLSANSNDKREVDSAIQTLETAYKSLVLSDDPDHGKDQEHTPYAMRAASELALANYRRARLEDAVGKGQYLDAARRWLEIVKPWSMGNDKRTYCKALITESRIARELGGKEEALRSAKRALQYGGKLEFSRIDCWIALGEANLLPPKPDCDSAIKAFLKARDFGNENPKVLAVCQLHLAEAYLASGNPSGAMEHYLAWKQTSYGNENSYVKGLAANVGALIREARAPFVIPYDVDVREAKKRIKRLKKWFTTVALEQALHHEQREAADLLDLSLGAFASWQKATDDPSKKRKRRKKKSPSQN